MRPRPRGSLPSHRARGSRGGGEPDSYESMGRFVRIARCVRELPVGEGNWARDPDRTGQDRTGQAILPTRVAS